MDTPTTKNVYGSWVRARRRAMQMTQESLSRKVLRYSVKLDRSALARIETGDRHIYDYELVAICFVLGSGVLPGIAPDRKKGQ